MEPTGAPEVGREDELVQSDHPDEEQAREPDQKRKSTSHRTRIVLKTVF
jgi:hypothetical protein